MARVLLVDDDPRLRDALARLLAVQGHHVVDLGDVIAAIRVLSCGGVELVVTDYQMRPLDGLHLARVVHDRWPTIPVILMSGELEARLERRALDLGVRATLAKPFSADALAAAVDRSLHTSPALAYDGAASQ